MKTKEVQTKNLYLFGDQTFNLQPHLRDLYRKAQNDEADALLSTFFRKAYEMLKHEDCGINALDEMTHWSLDTRDLPIEMALAVVLQIGTYILLSSSQEENGEREDTRTLGFCTGSLAAAVIGCSQTCPGDLVKLGIDAVRIAYKVGGVVGAASISISSIDADASRDSHALAILGPNAEVLFEQYLAESEPTDEQSKPYIIAYPPRGITVSAPPHVLQQKVKRWSTFEETGLEMRDLPIFGLYHARHLYSDDLVKGLVDESLGIESREHKAQVSVISGTGDVADARNSFQELMRSAVQQILRDPLRWRSVIEVVLEWVSQSDLEDDRVDVKLKIYGIGTKAGQLFLKFLTDLDVELMEIPGDSVKTST